MNIDENKARRDAEINRIVDISVAEENAKLQQGAPGPGDLAPVRHNAVYAIDPGSQTHDVDERDDYREIIEAPAVETEPAAVALVHGDIRRMTMEHVNNIRNRVPEMSGDARSDVGYLLEVIDAFDKGRMG